MRWLNRPAALRWRSRLALWRARAWVGALRNARGSLWVGAGQCAFALCVALFPWLAFAPIVSAQAPGSSARETIEIFRLGVVCLTAPAAFAMLLFACFEAGRARGALARALNAERGALEAQASLPARMEASSIESGLGPTELPRAPSKRSRL